MKFAQLINLKSQSVKGARLDARAHEYPWCPTSNKSQQNDNANEMSISKRSLKLK